MKLIHNAIIKAKFYRAGDEIPKEIVPPQLRKYEVKEKKEPAEPKEMNLMYQHNTAYSVDANGFLRPPVGRQMAEMQAEADEAEAIEDELADAPVDEAALEQAREDYRSDIQGQVAQARYTAESGDEAQDAIRAEQDANVESGEFDQMDVPPPKPKRQVPSAKSFVKRYGRFVLAATVELVPGEKLYRHRKRSLGVAERYIPFAKVKSKEES